MAAVPIYVWNGTAWQETGPTIPASPIKYQASAPSSPSTGDIWVDSDADVTSGSQQFQRFRFVASGGETTISGNDANGATLAYTAGAELVVLNGSTLVRGQDYTATNGTSITGLSPALVASDVLEVFSFIAFTVANTYTQSQVDGLLADYMGMRLIVPTSVSSGATISSTGAVSFTSQSSVSLNGCFSSTYDNYRILGTITSSSANDTIYFRLRAAGVDDTSGNYNRTLSESNSAGTTNRYDSGATSIDVTVTHSSSAYGGGYSFDLERPFLSMWSVGMLNSFGRNSVGGWVGRSGGFSHSVATSYDGLTIYTGSGTFTGTIRVYGYKN